MEAKVGHQSIGQRLHALRLAEGLSLREAGGRAQLSASFVRMVELDETGISIQRLGRLAAIYGLEVSDLLAGTIAADVAPDGPPPLRFGDEDEVAKLAAERFIEREPGAEDLVREFTQRSGFPVGEYFATDDELLVRAFEISMSAGSAEAIGANARAATPWQRIEQLVDQMSPDDDLTGRTLRLSLEIQVRAAGSQQLAHNHRVLYGYVVETFADVIMAGQADGSMASGVNPRQVAWQLCGLLDGLSLQVLARSPEMSAQEMRRLALDAAHHLLDPAG